MNTIIKFTFLEILKKKILYICTIMTLIFLGLYGVAIYFSYSSFGEMDAILRTTFSTQLISMGIYAMSFIISFLAIFSSVGAISSEIEQGHLISVLSKPIKRSEIILGKWIGIMGLLIAYTTVLFFCVIALNKVMGKEVIIQLKNIALIKALMTLYLLPIVLSAVGILVSIMVSTVGGGIFLTLLYFAGMIGGGVEQISRFITDQTAKTILSNIGIGISLMIPSDVIYRKVTSLLFTTSSGMQLSLDSMIGAKIEPSPLMMLYVILYILAILIIAIRKFNKKDI